MLFVASPASTDDPLQRYTLVDVLAIGPLPRNNDFLNFVFYVVRPLL
jgi:hypothetical protein